MGDDEIFVLCHLGYLAMEGGAPDIVSQVAEVLSSMKLMNDSRVLIVDCVSLMKTVAYEIIKSKIL